MDKSVFHRLDEFRWTLPQTGRMRVPAVLFASEQLVIELDNKVVEQLANIASLPGIVTAAYGMPDAHWGYGFPIGGVAAFDADKGGVVSAGGVGFDISCGVRTLLTGISIDELNARKEELANVLFGIIPAGIGSTGKIRLTDSETDNMLTLGAQWAVRRGYGTSNDLLRIENNGVMPGTECGQISKEARRRQRDEMGTLGSGNHYLEVQEIAEIYDEKTAEIFGLRKGEIVVSMHCGSRGLGHQIATEFSKSMLKAAGKHGIYLPDRELACAPVKSEEGQAYLGAMRAAVNCALANRQILAHLAREGFFRIFGKIDMPLLYDVSHNICHIEEHIIDGKKQTLFVHRKGATRALGPGNSTLPEEFRPTGQPVLIGGTMGTASYILAGTNESQLLSFSSACHGAGRRMSRSQAARQWQGRDVITKLALRNIIIRSSSHRGVAEEAPGAYKDVSEVVEATVKSNLARKIARVVPLICIKG
ncbi:MAG: RtcB family protein [Kiritimatiellia bacterium]|nr:RtcB family protein [Kiritimatiellia bacterium]